VPLRNHLCKTWWVLRETFWVALLSAPHRGQRANRRVLLVVKITLRCPNSKHSLAPSGVHSGVDPEDVIPLHYLSLQNHYSSLQNLKTQIIPVQEGSNIEWEMETFSKRNVVWFRGMLGFLDTGMHTDHLALPSAVSLFRVSMEHRSPAHRIKCVTKALSEVLQIQISNAQS